MCFRSIQSRVANGFVDYAGSYRVVVIPMCFRSIQSGGEYNKTQIVVRALESRNPYVFQVNSKPVGEARLTTLVGLGRNPYVFQVNSKTTSPTLTP